MICPVNNELNARGCMNETLIQQYDYVRITAIRRTFLKEECEPGTRTPIVGDIAAVIEIYDNPKLGYELESVNEEGETNWLVTVAATDMEFEKITPPCQTLPSNTLNVSLTTNISRPIWTLLSVVFFFSCIVTVFLNKESYWRNSAFAATIVSGVILAICLIFEKVLNKVSDDDDDPQFPPMH